MSRTILTDWEEYEDKLQSLSFYIDDRIERYEHKQINNPSLLKEFKTLLFYIEEVIHLDGEYREKIKNGIDFLDENIEDPEIILEELDEYSHRIKNDIFSNFFSKEEAKGIYRINYRTKKGHFFCVLRGNNIMDILNSLRNLRGEIHLDNPKQDVIKISNCEYFWIDRKNKQNYRCSKLKGPCVLTYATDFIECPNLENLVQIETDFFEEFINGKYKTKD